MSRNFEKGGKYEKWYALYEAVATILYTPGKVTKSATHVRDSIDLKRIMIFVWLMLFPAMFFGMFNIGHQAASVLSATVTVPDTWQVALFHMLGGELTAESGWGSKMLVWRLLVPADLCNGICRRWFLGSVICLYP